MADNDRNERIDQPESHITTDRDEIRRWADERDAVPAARDQTEGDPEYRFFNQDTIEEGYLRRDWDEFFEDMESRDRALVYRDEGDAEGGVGYHEIIDRDEAAARATVEDRDVEERLLEGETVTTEVTETTVVEREITETDTIESEVVDTETIRSRIVDAELVEWDVVDTDANFELTAAAAATDHDVHVTADEGRVSYGDVDLDTQIDGDFEAEIEETWRIRREVDEQAIIESEVVDTDVEESGHVEEDTVRTEVNVEGVQRSIVESDAIDADVGGAEIVERDVIETEELESGRLESRLVEQKVYEDRIRRRKLLRFDFVESEVIDTETLDSEMIESDIVEVDYEEDVDTAAATTPEGETGTVGAEDRPREETDAGGVATGERGDPTDDTGTIGEANDVEAAAGETRREITDDDRGKTVVDRSGEEIGVVSRVEEGTAYVEPHPGFFDRIGAKLGWGNDEDAHPISSESVTEINRNRIVVDAEAEAEIEDADREGTR